MRIWRRLAPLKSVSKWPTPLLERLVMLKIASLEFSPSNSQIKISLEIKIPYHKACRLLNIKYVGIAELHINDNFILNASPYQKYNVHFLTNNKAEVLRGRTNQSQVWNPKHVQLFPGQCPEFHHASLGPNKKLNIFQIVMDTDTLQISWECTNLEKWSKGMYPSESGVLIACILVHAHCPPL